MQFMVRVEIHHASREQYDQLHARLAAENIIRTLTAESDGKQYHAPIGTYWTEAYTDRWAVLRHAKLAALQVDPQAEVMVAGDGRIVFFNCEAVQEFSFASLLGSAPLTSTTPAQFWPSFYATPKEEMPRLAVLHGLMSRK